MACPLHMHTLPAFDIFTEFLENSQRQDGGKAAPQTPKAPLTGRWNPSAMSAAPFQLAPDMADLIIGSNQPSPIVHHQYR